MHEVVIIAELNLGEFQFAHALDKDLRGTIDHNLGDGLILMQGLNRPQPQHIVDDIVHHLRTVAARDSKGVFIGKLLDIAVDNLLDLFAVLCACEQYLLLVRRHIIYDALMCTLLGG